MGRKLGSPADTTPDTNRCDIWPGQKARSLRRARLIPLWTFSIDRRRPAGLYPTGECGSGSCRPWILWRLVAIDDFAAQLGATGCCLCPAIRSGPQEVHFGEMQVL